MAFPESVGGMTAIVISSWMSLGFGSTLESAPYNVAEGCVLPLLVHTNLTGRGAALFIRTSPVPTGVFTFQRTESTFPPFAWEDVPLEQAEPGEFVDEPGSLFRLYRLKPDSSPVYQSSLSVCQLDCLPPVT